MNRHKAMELLQGGPDGINEWNRRRSKDEPIPDLSYANLRGCRLRRANFRFANLSNADFIDADLRQAFFRGANLQSAKLIDVNLRNAFLMDADLTSAFLYDSDLSGARLTGADLTDANLGRTTLATDLSEALGLDLVVHHMPSYLSLDALLSFSGKLPDHFLRGCGLAEQEIEYFGARTSFQPRFYSSFISYSHEDATFARRLHDGLQACGIRCWLDEKQLLPGEDIFDEVTEAIRLRDKMLLCASKHSLTSWWVDNEIENAFRKEQRLMREKGRKTLALIPLNLDGYLFSSDWTRGFKAQVHSRVAANFRGWEDNDEIFQQGLKKLARALTVDDTDGQ